MSKFDIQTLLDATDSQIYPAWMRHLYFFEYDLLVFFFDNLIEKLPKIPYSSVVKKALLIFIRIWSCMLSPFFSIIYSKYPSLPFRLNLSGGRHFFHRISFGNIQRQQINIIHPIGHFNGKSPFDRIEWVLFEVRKDNRVHIIQIRFDGIDKIDVAAYGQWLIRILLAFGLLH